MAENFIDAVREMHATLASIKAQPPAAAALSPDDVAQIALDAVTPVIVGIVKQNNVDVVRVVRDNPSLISRAR